MHRTITSLYLPYCKTMNQKNILILGALLLGAGFLRLIIDIPNFSPIGAMALMGGFYLGRSVKAYLLPLLALFVSDVVLALNGGSYGDYFLSSGMVPVYGSFVLISFLGTKMNTSNFSNILKFSTLSAISFFLVTNFGVWMSGGLYPQTFNGLIQCYTAGLAFYRQDMFGSFFLNFLMATAGISLVIHYAMQVLGAGSLRSAKVKA